MKIEKRNIFACLMLFLMIFSLSAQINMNYNNDADQENLKVRTSDLRFL
ncbi:MAG: hypothetical protein HWN80_02850 [Candidatus Lokiarchaeota archaeon]|nr:hypothetical protein [Candidatus Lokiarchaeota archaeon]